MEMQISQAVMGNVYVSREIQIMCKQGVAVIPKEMVVFKNGNKAVSAMVIFEHDSVRHQLPLSQFQQPPSIQDLMKILPCTEKPVVQSRPQVSRQGRFSAFG